MPSRREVTKSSGYAQCSVHFRGNLERGNRFLRNSWEWSFKDTKGGQEEEHQSLHYVALSSTHSSGKQEENKLKEKEREIILDIMA